MKLIRAVIVLFFISTAGVAWAAVTTDAAAKPKPLSPALLRALERDPVSSGDDTFQTDISVNPDLQAEAQALAASPDEFYRATVVEIISEGSKSIGGLAQPYQHVRVRLDSGPATGTTVEFQHGGDILIRDHQRVQKGDTVVLIQLYQFGELTYGIVDKYRLPRVAVISVFFIALIVLLGRGRGLGAMLGLIVSIVVLVGFVIPQIVRGTDPFTICFLGAVFIAVVSMYCAHGFNRRSSIALVSTLLTLGISAFVATVFVWATKLSGVSTEDAFFLQSGVTENLNFQGLLLGAIMIGALGVLDDITIGQAAAIDEIHKADPTVSFRELYTRGLSVGREHIAALVNTLVLAYAGASFPLFLLFYTQQAVPAWVTFNSELIVDEVVRTLVGSTTLMIAVPITTLLTAWWWTRSKT